LPNNALLAERARIKRKIEAGTLTIEEANRQVREFVAHQAATSTTPPEELVVAEAEARKTLGGLSPEVVSPPPKVATVPSGPAPTLRPVPGPPLEPVTTTPQEAEATGQLLPEKTFQTLEESRTAAEAERIEAARGRFFEEGGFKAGAAVTAERKREVRELEQAAGELRQLGIPLVGEGFEEPPELVAARGELASFLETVEGREQDLTPEEFATFTRLQTKVGEEFGKTFGISPELLAERTEIAKQEGLFEKLEKEQKEALKAISEESKFFGEFARLPGETEQEFFKRTIPIAQQLNIPAAKEFATGAIAALKAPFAEPTFAGKVFRASVDIEKKAGPELGPGLAALGQIGARILGTFEETTSFLGEITGTQPKGGRARIRAPSAFTPFTGMSPLEYDVNLARRLISGLAAGAITIPLESKGISAATRTITPSIRAVPRGIGGALLRDLAAKKAVKVTSTRIKIVPLGERSTRLGFTETFKRVLKPIQIQRTKRTISGLEAAERFVDKIESFQVRREIFGRMADPFFGKPERFLIGKVKRIETVRTVSPAGRGGIAGREIIEETVQRLQFEPLFKVSRRQFQKLLQSFQTLDPKTAGIRGRSFVRVLGSGSKAAKSGVAIIEETPGAEVLRVLQGAPKAISQGFSRDVRAFGKIVAELKVVPSPVEAPLGLRGRIGLFFRQSTRRDIFRVPFGERGADIARPRLRRPFVTQVSKVPTTQLKLEGLPEITVRKTVRRVLPSIPESISRGAQRIVPSRSFVVKAVTEGDIRIVAKPLKEAGEFFRSIPARQVGPMKPFDLASALDIRSEAAVTKVTTEAGRGGGFSAGVTAAADLAQQTRVALNVITGVPSQIKPIVSSRFLSLLRGGAATAAAVGVSASAQPRAIPRPSSLNVVKPVEVAKPIEDAVPVSSQFTGLGSSTITATTQAQGLRLKQVQQMQFVMPQVTFPSLATRTEFRPKRGGIVFPEEEKTSARMRRRKQAGVVRRLRLFPVVDISKVTAPQFGKMEFPKVEVKI